MTLHPSITGTQPVRGGRNRKAPSVTGGARKIPVRNIQRTRNLFGSPAQGGLSDERGAHINREIEAAHDAILPKADVA
jgi:hypothetical protein